MAPATADEAALRTFVRRRRSLLPDVSTFEVPAWPPGALEATTFVWKRRVINEATSVELAEHLLAVVARTPLGSEVLQAALQRLLEDEADHVKLATDFVRKLGAEPPRPTPELPPPHTEAPARMLVRYVLTGLYVCEAVSAARLTAVRDHTDLPLPLACIEVFLRDEIAHADLGLLLLPTVLSHCQAEVGAAETQSLVESELRGTFRHLDQVVGMDAERRGLTLEHRPQPPDNAGVVEPMIDALAFRQVIHEQIIPRLSRLGLDAQTLWNTRTAP